MQTVKVVVGGGLAGLTAATCLARDGHPVKLYEMGKAVGGRARTTRAGDFLFNFGPHALYRGPGLKVLEELGIKFNGRSPRVAGLAVRDGQPYRLPASPASILASGLLSPRAKLELTGFMARLPLLEATSYSEVTLTDWLEREIQAPDLRAYLETLNRVGTYANLPHLQSAEVFIRQTRLALKNVLYLDGGWQSLVDGLSRAARSAGVEIITGQRVTGLVAGRGGPVSGVRLAGGQVQPAAAVVLALEPAGADRLLDGRLAGYLNSFVPVRAACLDLALRRLPDPETRLAFGVDRPLYFSVHSAYARLGPEGTTVLHVAKYLPQDYTDPGADRQELEALLDLIQPGWREQVLEMRYLPNMTVYNTVVRADRGGYAGRPPVEVEGVANVFLAGDWVGAEGILADAALVSARQAARLASSATAGLEAGPEFVKAG